MSECISSFPEQDLALEAGTLGCSHCRGMTPKARNVLRTDNSAPADKCASERPPPVKGAQTHAQGSPGDSLTR